VTVPLADLVSRLQAAVPPRDGVPSGADYEQHVQDAVLQLGQDVPLRRTTELNVVRGTATYALPGDFLYLIELEPLMGPVQEGVIIGSNGLVPVGADWCERVEVVGSEITFYPTPVYTATRTLRYAALYALTGEAGSEQYVALTQNGARLALLYAQYLALTQQASAVAGDGWRYQIGDEMVDKSNQGKGLANQANSLLAQYQRAVQAQKGYGSQAQAGAEAAIWAS